MQIGVDLMGGDTPPKELFKALLEAQKLVSASFKVYASEELIPVLGESEKISFVSSSEVITMEDDPITSVRKKTKASLTLGIKDLKNGLIDAFVSVGNTGALVTAATLSIEKEEGILRPALLALLPTRKKSLAVIDVGANVSCRAEHLLQFGQLGAAYMQKNHKIKRPAVGLLNIGVELEKGKQEHKLAYKLLEKSSLNFIGNIEGTSAFNGDVDVLVTDGFSGNIFLKASEGIASLIFEECKLEPRFNYEEYPGALLCGLKKTVIKCHGNSGPKSLLSAILAAFKYFGN